MPSILISGWNWVPKIDFSLCLIISYLQFFDFPVVISIGGNLEISKAWLSKTVINFFEVKLFSKISIISSPFWIEVVFLIVPPKVRANISAP